MCLMAAEAKVNKSALHQTTENMGGARLKFESWKVRIHIQTASQRHFFLLSG